MIKHDTEMDSIYPIKNIVIMAISAIILTACIGTGAPRSPQLIQESGNGSPESQYAIGLRYISGSGVEQNYTIAADYFSLASAQGHQQSQYLLGIAYTTGRGVTTDRTKAVELFYRAAKAGHARAQYQLGEAFANGRGVEKDIAWASRWYEKSARQKHAQALFSVGIMRATGLVGMKNLELAWVWLQLASDTGHDLAKQAVERIEDEMSPAALSRARQNVDRWRWTNNPPYDDPPTIRYLQRGLIKLGFLNGKDDGLAGPVTNAAIRAFLQDHTQDRGMTGPAAIRPELVSMVRRELLTD